MVEKYLELSTCHMTARDNELLDADGPEIPFGFDRHEYGFWIYVAPDAGSRTDVADAARGAFSDGLLAAMELAAAKDCRWIRFDCDGPVLAELPRFDW